MLKVFISCLLLVASTFSYASEPIEFVVKSAAGGPDDTISRQLQEHLEKTTDLTFILNYKPGAGHMIGYAHFYELTKPTILIVNGTVSDYAKSDVNDKIFDLGTFASVVYVNSNSGIKDLNGLIKLSKERPVRFGHGGVGSISEIATRKLCPLMECIIVPYKSGAPAMNDLMGNHIDAFALNPYGTDHFLKNDRLTTILLLSTNKHVSLNIPILPHKLKKLENKDYVALYGRNLTSEQKAKIVNSLKTMDISFYNNNGLWK